MMDSKFVFALLVALAGAGFSEHVYSFDPDDYARASREEIELCRSEVQAYHDDPGGYPADRAQSDESWAQLVAEARANPGKAYKLDMGKSGRDSILAAEHDLYEFMRDGRYFPKSRASLKKSIALSKKRDGHSWGPPSLPQGKAMLCLMQARLSLLEGKPMVKAGNVASVAAAATASGAQTAPSGNPQSGKRITSGGGKWPAGVEPGNLFIISIWYPKMSMDAHWLLVAAKTRAEAVALVEEKVREQNREQHGADYDFALRGVVAECTGPNWGAVVKMQIDNRSAAFGASCGAKSPRDAILLASKACEKEAGRPCSSSHHVSVGHSGARPWGGTKTGFGAPNLVGSFPSNDMTFSALGASTLQFSGPLDEGRSPETAIQLFGRACGAQSNGRDTHSCWITSRNLECVMSVREDPRDRKSNQQQCVDRKLSAEGYM